MGIEITVIDDSDYVGWAAAATRINEIYMTNVQSMVDNIKSALLMSRPIGLSCAETPVGPKFGPLQFMRRSCVPVVGAPPKISRLNILDHGDATGFQIGSDRVSIATLPTHQAKLNELNGRFERDGFVHLQSCEIGQDRTLLLRLAAIFGVSVYAGTGNQNAVYRYNTGDYVRADPDGTFDAKVGRP